MKFLVLLLICAACGGSDFKKIEKLDGFRILGIQSPQSEVDPGDIVNNIRVLFSDVGGGRAISGTTVSCIDPGIALGAKVSCDHDSSRVNGIYNLDTAADDETGGFFTGLSTSVASVTVPAQIFQDRSTREQLNGVGYIIIFTFEVDGKTVSAFKRIVATNRVLKNTNPTGLLYLNGSAIASIPDKDDELSVVSSSAETYDYENVDGTVENRTEEIQVAWYISEGELNKPKTFANEETKFLEDRPSAPFTLFAVIRDERGGFSYLRY